MRAVVIARAAIIIRGTTNQLIEKKKWGIIVNVVKQGSCLNVGA